MDNEDYELYKGKSLGSLFSDIVKNQEEKKQQLDILITDLRSMIKDIKDAVMIIPLLKEYYDIGVRNDEQLIKLAAIQQRLVAGQINAESDGGTLLSDEEKRQLMSDIDASVKNMHAKVPELDKTKLEKKE